MFGGFKGRTEALRVLLMITKDRSCLLDLIVVRIPHLRLVSGIIPLQPSIYSDLLVVALCNITRLRFLSHKAVTL